MLDIRDAKALGNQKCIELFGEEFCNRYAEFGGSAYESFGSKVRCSYGMNDVVPGEKDKHVLTEEKYKYYLTIDVDRNNGDISIVESNLPQRR